MTLTHDVRIDEEREERERKGDRGGGGGRARASVRSRLTSCPCFSQNQQQVLKRLQEIKELEAKLALSLPAPPRV